MFWSANYIVVRELKCLLKEENVTLTQVLEADDILQECKADNKDLIQFLTRPDILAELITLITEEPPKNVELSSQYRHANIASEVLTSNLSMLRDRLSMEATQMNRLCDFVNKDPPLNPLLASYFSKTIEMLLERSPKQDWYLHHIVCLHVLDMFKSRRDFLPNLLRHISTSAISDTFNCFLHLGSPFNKIILEWLDEHQFLESLIQIICGTYDHEEALAATTPAPELAPEPTTEPAPCKLDSNHNAEADTAPAPPPEGTRHATLYI
ncbi:jg23304 [Pararge aegeria aegeria]|uniref:Jg23304 protein n=1 Tax=Pararge aegeria aegeria TaxID=348720 RepID=A0A8S4SC78_9NEOP|nr:jg23304 [Pararge aegeria aegeria]